MTVKFWEKFKHKTFCDDRIVMINADCEAVMAEIRDREIDLVLTDPPYGIDMANKINTITGGVKFDKKDWDKHIPKKEIFDSITRISRDQIIFGGNYFTDFLIPSSCWIVWDKKNGDSLFADAEIAWTSFKSPIRIIQNHWCGSAAIHETGENKIHPTQKPFKLFIKILNKYSKENDLIFDAFAGSFTTAIACIRTKRRFIGVELDPVYFEKAVERVDTELKQLTLF